MRGGGGECVRGGGRGGGGNQVWLPAMFSKKTLNK